MVHRIFPIAPILPVSSAERRTTWRSGTTGHDRPALRPHGAAALGFGAALLLHWALTALSAGRSRVPRRAYADDR